MANRTLMTHQLVVQYSAAKKLSADQCSMHDLYSIEYAQARKVFGFDLWTSMLAAKADYSGEATWMEGATVPQGQIRNFKGIAYKSLASTTNQPPYAGEWEVAPIFDEANECSETYEELFCNFLAPYLAHTILFKRLPFMDQVEFKDKRIERADDQAFRRAQIMIGNQRATAWSNLKYYMRLDAQKAKFTGCLSGWRGADDDDCKTNDVLMKSRHMRTGLYGFG